MIIIIVLFLFTPIDICFRLSDRLQVSILPVVLSNGCNYSIRQYRIHGFTENKDYLIYRWKTTTHPTLAIVFFIPYRACANEIHMQNHSFYHSTEQNRECTNFPDQNGL
jgi:hypothetical protein